MSDNSIDLGIDLAQFQKMNLEELQVAYDYCHKKMYDLYIEKLHTSSDFAINSIKSKINHCGKLISIIFQQIVQRKHTYAIRY